MSGIGSNFSWGGQNGTATYNSGTTADQWTSTAGPFSWLVNAVSQATLQTAICADETYGATQWCPN
jgi:hypothetical protein